MHHQVAGDALDQGVCLEVRYDGFVRVVEVHAVGSTSSGNVVMRVWQVLGGSVHHEPTGWKLLRLDEVRSAVLTEQKSMAPRAGYKPGDRAMKQIYCQL